MRHSFVKESLFVAFLGFGILPVARGHDCAHAPERIVHLVNGAAAVAANHQSDPSQSEQRRIQRATWNHRTGDIILPEEESEFTLYGQPEGDPLPTELMGEAIEMLERSGGLPPGATILIVRNKPTPVPFVTNPYLPSMHAGDPLDLYATGFGYRRPAGPIPQLHVPMPQVIYPRPRIFNDVPLLGIRVGNRIRRVSPQVQVSFMRFPGQTLQEIGEGGMNVVFRAPDDERDVLRASRMISWTGTLTELGLDQLLKELNDDQYRRDAAMQTVGQATYNGRRFIKVEQPVVRHFGDRALLERGIGRFRLRNPEMPELVKIQWAIDIVTSLPDSEIFLVTEEAWTDEIREAEGQTKPYDRSPQQLARLRRVMREQAFDVLRRAKVYTQGLSVPEGWITMSEMQNRIFAFEETVRRFHYVLRGTRNEAGNAVLVPGLEQQWGMVEGRTLVSPRYRRHDYAPGVLGDAPLERREIGFDVNRGNVYYDPEADVGPDSWAFRFYDP